MSIEASVEELYGDSKEEAWKQEEVERLKAEQGIAEIEEPGINLEAGDFQTGTGGAGGDNKDRKKTVEDEPQRIQGAVKDSKGAGAPGNLRGGKE